ncbi:MAG: hypothetical protein Ta2D_12820 [Rickettsiales bacterium]|nr:MAG: hypothetical protein Ta2D_12820 [Rickettsiales bacterium]
MDDKKIKEILLNGLPNKIKNGNEIFKAKSGYEKILCDELEWKCEKSTYWDADKNGIKIEIKKGNIWLNVRRYAEMVFNKIDYSNDITAIFTKNTKIKNIKAVYFLKTSLIIKDVLKIDNKIAKQVLDMDKHWKKCEYLGNDTDSQVNFKVGAYKKLSFCSKIFDIK